MRNLVLLLAVIVPTLAFGQVEELENPGTVTAVQDRQYRMNHELTLGIGVLPLDAFYKGVMAQIGYTYHFSDSFAWTIGRAAYSYNLDTDLRNQLERDFGVLPTAFDQVNWFIGSDLMWSPWYGKFAYLNQSVTHMEAFLVGGLSVMKLTLKSGSNSSFAGIAGGFRPALNLGLGLRLFTSKVISWRLDLTDNVVVSDKIFNVPTITLSAALNFGASE